MNMSATEERLREAIKACERPNKQHGFYCIMCEHYGEHAPDCKVGLALAESSAPGPVAKGSAAPNPLSDAMDLWGNPNIFISPRQSWQPWPSQRQSVAPPEHIRGADLEWAQKIQADWEIAASNEEEIERFADAIGRVRQQVLAEVRKAIDELHKPENTLRAAIWRGGYNQALRELLAKLEGLK
jgi:hypothetical protein